jgi:hypothetical protein
MSHQLGFHKSKKEGGRASHLRSRRLRYVSVRHGFVALPSAYHHIQQ